MVKFLLIFTTFMVLFLYGMDREVARQDWVSTGYANPSSCIFQSNCDYYNNK